MPKDTRHALTVAVALLGCSLHAEQIPNPTITASARPFNASFSAENLFDAGNAEFASLTQGAVSAPFTTDPNDGTWVEMDFGQTVEFDRFVMRSRANGADVVGRSRLIVSDDPTFDETDEIYTFEPSGSNGAGIIQNLYGTASGRYARWEVLTSTGSGRNLGANQMWFLKTPAGHSFLPAPTIPDWYSEHSAPYVPGNAVDNNFGTDYASAGAQEQVYIAFDFGAVRPISGFEFLNRFSDRITSFDLIFSDETGTVVDTKSFTADADNGNLVSSAVFEPVNAQSVRLQGTGFAGAVNTGARDIRFLTTAPLEPVFTATPTGGTRLAGDRFILRSAVLGANPVTFQWRRNGEEIENATGSTLEFASLAEANSGNYDVVVTTPHGSITSEAVELTVLDPALDITSDLLLHLRMDESSGELAMDSSGNDNHGTLNNFPAEGTQWIEGRIDGAVRINPEGGAGDDYILVTDEGQLDLSASRVFTLALWVNGAAVQENGSGIIAKGAGAGGEQFALDVNSGVYRFYVRNETGGAAVFSTSVAPNDTWQHLAIVFSSELSRVKVYLNGAEILSGTPPATLLQNLSPISLGSRQAGTGDFDLNFNGAIDDVRLYQRALTARDVMEIHGLASLLPPIIVTQAQGGEILALDNTTLSVVADGSLPLTYQWKKNGANIEGATSATLPLNEVTSTAAGSYTVTITNPLQTITSDPAVITINDPAPALETGLALHLKLDETSGLEAADSSGGNRTGTLQDFATEAWTPGIIDGALAFNPEGAADNDTVLVQDDGALDFSATREFTIAAWVNGDPTQEGGGAIFAKGAGGGGEQYALDVFNGYRFYGWTGATPNGVYMAGSSVLPNNTWQHVAGVFSAALNRVRLYVNGVEVARGTPSATIVQNFEPVSIGSRLGGGGTTEYNLNFEGMIDDVRIYNRPLTPREIKTLAAEGAPPALVISRDGNSMTISWEPRPGLALMFTDELPAAEWTAVPGVVNGSVTVATTEDERYYQLQGE